MYTQLQHGEGVQLFHDHIIICIKQASERGGIMLQDFAESFCTYYLIIICNYQSYEFYYRD